MVLIRIPSRLLREHVIGPRLLHFPKGVVQVLFLRSVCFFLFVQVENQRSHYRSGQFELLSNDGARFSHGSVSFHRIQLFAGLRTNAWGHRLHRNDVGKGKTHLIPLRLRGDFSHRLRRASFLSVFLRVVPGYQVSNREGRHTVQRVGVFWLPQCDDSECPFKVVALFRVGDTRSGGRGRGEDNHRPVATGDSLTTSSLPGNGPFPDLVLVRTPLFMIPSCGAGTFFGSVVSLIILRFG